MRTVITKITNTGMGTWEPVCCSIDKKRLPIITKFVAYNGNVTHSIIVHISVTSDETVQKLANSNTDV